MKTRNCSSFKIHMTIIIIDLKSNYTDETKIMNIFFTAMHFINYKYKRNIINAIFTYSV